MFGVSEGTCDVFCTMNGDNWNDVVHAMSITAPRLVCVAPHGRRPVTTGRQISNGQSPFLDERECALSLDVCSALTTERDAGFADHQVGAHV